MASLPGGTVTFVFTDIEGSTKLLQELGDEAYGQAAGEHRRIVRETFGAHGGAEVDTQGDAFFYSFPRARDAVAAAVGAQRALRDHDWPGSSTLRVRMGLHTGEPQVGDEGYLGLDVVRAARIAAAGHGGQILVSETTRALLGNRLPEGVAVRDLGNANLKDVQHEHVYELAVDGAVETRPLKVQHEPSLGERIAARVQTHVEQELERAFAQPKAAPRPDEDEDEAGMAKELTALAGAGLLILVLTVVAIVAIVLLVKLAFF
jgi:class 3 adenylate cyclase